MTSASVLATIFYRPNSAGEAYEIVRQSKDGARTLQATETSPLMPGDVLKITPKAVATSPRRRRSRAAIGPGAGAYSYGKPELMPWLTLPAAPDEGTSTDHRTRGGGLA